LIGNGRATLRGWSLCSSDAVIHHGDGEPAVGADAIRALFEGFVASGRKFQRGTQQAPVINGNLALTSTRLPDGTVTAEVARRQKDGTWLWAIDRFSIV
jgi:ketosteroid isomerase-like protein